MKIICVIEDNGGMMFNHRRLSKDRALREKICKISSDAKLRMDTYTARQFDSLPPNASVSDDFLNEAEDSDYCFVEDRSLKACEGKIDTFFLFHWNRRYPSDMKLDFVPADAGMRLVSSEDFPGYSHEKITLEVWTR